MWRRIYLLLVAVRLYFALSPSYLHPDENFQGPEVIAGHLFPYPFHQTWEWTTAHPVRSVFPLWPLYGFPMTLLKWIWADEENLVSPGTIYYALRAIMFGLSFVLEDWAIHELIVSPRKRRQALLLVASSYVTWTFQTHTFSNASETILVLWSQVLIERILNQENRSSLVSCTILSLLLVLGIFNRITFPAFILIPGLRLVPHLLRKPFSLVCILSSGVFFTVLAIFIDTAFYRPDSTASFSTLVSTVFKDPVIAPLNSLVYNTSTANLALHGLHPHYQHFLVNLPQLLGPALFLIFSPSRIINIQTWKNPRITSALCGTFILSILPHQEPRFLLPVIPLLLICAPPLPQSKIALRVFWASWMIFNTILAVLMGTYHQGGIVPVQLAIPNAITALNSNGTLPISPTPFSDSLVSNHDISANGINNVTVVWWKTYPPPEYLLGSNEGLNPRTNSSVTITTKAVMGLPVSKLEALLEDNLIQCTPSNPSPKGSTQATLLVYPYSAMPTLVAHQLETEEAYASKSGKRPSLTFSPLYFYRNHINLDDIDFPTDGLFGTVDRVIGMRGLGVWRVQKSCDS